jgi:predicted NodU family carbamoyl transferase
LAHLASAFYPSSFREATVVSVDGFGDFASADRGVLSVDRRANGAKHIIQRKRARRLPAGRAIPHTVHNSSP